MRNLGQIKKSSRGQISCQLPVIAGDVRPLCGHCKRTTASQTGIHWWKLLLKLTASVAMVIWEFICNWRHLISTFSAGLLLSMDVLYVTNIEGCVQVLSIPSVYLQCARLWLKQIKLRQRQREWCGSSSVEFLCPALFICTLKSKKTFKNLNTYKPKNFFPKTEIFSVWIKLSG